MPIGKNSLKRVTNNGYSSVKTTAPDMENSEIVTEKAPTTEKVAEKTSTKTTTTVKTATKTATTKSTAKSEPKNTAKKTEKTETKTPVKKTTEKTATAKKPTPKTEAKSEAKVSATTIPAPREVVMAIVDTDSTVDTEKPYCNVGDKMPHFLL